MPSAWSLTGAAAVLCVALAGPAAAVEEPTFPLGPLSGVQKPFPNAAARAFLRPGGETALLQLGKALFFDQQVGSDGVACASCHYHAGADIRVYNALNPGIPGGDSAFNRTRSGQGPGANLLLTANDFPQHELLVPTERESNVLFDSNDTISSAGTRYGEFVSGGVSGNALRDRCKSAEEAIFRFHGYDVRRVEPRNTPTTINSVFFHRLFWDGRANNVFNGAGVFGKRDANARVLRNSGGSIVAEQVEVKDGALGSQADGPPLSDFEMSCAHKSFADLGRRLLTKKALRFQSVHSADSSLGVLRNAAGKGLKDTYLKMIQRAFKDEYWNGKGKYLVNAGIAVPATKGYTQPETNFPLFFGLAVAMYESTLVSGDTSLDRGDLQGLALEGKEVFETKGKCIACHDGPELSKAASHLFPEAQENGLVERMVMGDGGTAFYDNGFYNIGVTPTANDPGLGGKDPFGNPLSFTRQYVSGNKVDPFEVDESTFVVPCAESPCDLNGARVAVDGAFKTPTLRNIGLTPPYFHNGGVSTLEGVIEFYDRGGNRRSVNGGDTTGTGPLGDGDKTGGAGSNLDPDIDRLELTQHEKDALREFLLSLTDNRVACLKAPFDGPELILVNGHKATDTNRNGEADPYLVRLPQTGAGGRQADGRSCIANSGNLFDAGLRVLLTDAAAQAPLAAPAATMQALINLLISGPRR